jgi:hypothetical protein
VLDSSYGAAHHFSMSRVSRLTRSGAASSRPRPRMVQLLDEQTIKQFRSLGYLQ